MNHASLTTRIGGSELEDDRYVVLRPRPRSSKAARFEVLMSARNRLAVETEGASGQLQERSWVSLSRAWEDERCVGSKKVGGR